MIIIKYRLITGNSRPFFYLNHPASQHSSHCNLDEHPTANSVLVQSATFEVPFTCSIAEYANMVLRMVLMLVMQFMPHQNTSNMPQTVQYHMEECLLKFTSIARHQYFPTFTLQLRVSLINISMNNQTLFGRYSAVRILVLISEQLQDTLMFTHTREGRTLHTQGMYPCQMQWVQHHGLDNYGQKLEFCRLLTGNCQTLVHWIILYNNWRKKLSTVCTLEHQKHSSAVLNVAEHIKNSQWQLQQPTTAVHNQGARCAAASSGIFKKPVLSTGDSKLKPIWWS